MCPRYLQLSVYGSDAPQSWNDGREIKTRFDLTIRHCDLTTLKTTRWDTANFEQMSNSSCWRPLAEGANTTASVAPHMAISLLLLLLLLLANSRWLTTIVLNLQPTFAECRHNDSSSMQTKKVIRYRPGELHYSYQIGFQPTGISQANLPTRTRTHDFAQCHVLGLPTYDVTMKRWAWTFY